MFNTASFGSYLSRLRKQADMTQHELADRLNVTRQAVSKYERGDSFPDISVLVPISEIFSVTLDDLIRAGEPTESEQALLCDVARGRVATGEVTVSSMLGIAPLLKPSTLDQLSRGLGQHGVDISNIIELAEFLSDETTARLIENADFSTLPYEVIEKLGPFLSYEARCAILDAVLFKGADWHLLIPLRVQFSLVEEAVIEGAIPMAAIHEWTEYKYF